MHVLNRWKADETPPQMLKTNVLVVNVPCIDYVEIDSKLMISFESCLYYESESTLSFLCKKCSLKTLIFHEPENFVSSCKKY